ncbi:helix-hairpin-helix domain-containing protein [Flavobacterium sp. Fl-77]|uniref:Helix-hairpin-helix domain-containing protein n=1 Tax=Flavobacterium flavipigmentatum TaxID=2893884 RepID=A0AAJ2SIJ6_9FLAO|nr:MULTISPECIES: helix-hairpin-helix domain-containing protein [unclassified Flavobacterium]MDX6183082.1 helix-hairpin-helix domain-containing protein [Flavobacterium sp. Fl-33]MDX6186849.1 helix-hairpin-helix domain-containing protein [Flavobacterium sp. Fl-77]UFH40502.1 helix-hairpin-helix domain-containing protein [Flavobacterium sp. F-70]
MNFRSLVQYFRFTNQQRTGIFLFLVVIVSLQLVYFFVDFNGKEKITPDEQKWMTLQHQIDVLKSLKYNQKPKVFTFNPNFISDYKGYKLGMSVQEIDRLLAFRKENKYVNSAKEFQEVTKVSDSLLLAISPYFKFPDWVTKGNAAKKFKKDSNQKIFLKKEKIVTLDINQATQEDLMKIYGIGEALSIRILKQKESFGGFVSMEQMNDIWGLSPEVVVELNLHFKVSAIPKFKKIAINDASLKELSQFPYFRYALAKQIVTYRSMNGKITNIEDLVKIKAFPVEKAKIISLYLEF